MISVLTTLVIHTFTSIPHVNAQTKTIFQFENTDQYANAENGCIRDCAVTQSNLFKSSHACDLLDSSPCICSNTTASSALRDDIWDDCFNRCGLQSAYPATSILVGYCESATSLAVAAGSGGPATVAASTTTTTADGEIYVEDTAEFSSIMARDRGGCAGVAALSACRSFKAAQSCDPADAFPCICGDQTVLYELNRAISSRVYQGCGPGDAQEVTKILPGYCASNSARVAGLPGSSPATATGASSGSTSTGGMETGQTTTTTTTPTPKLPTSNSMTRGEIANIVVGCVFGALGVVVAIGVAVWARKYARQHPNGGPRHWILHIWNVNMAHRVSR
ncbi:hypothetical protein CONLIGDRAFT_708549 [Coniochaeta ligniaria NRRL 30616]|uniref:Extracellular membrane protein CFEM domain-containing protein n=1 Tax=Coniochaeta ligniaria NRRL 30616 TaxID=1408157 RepID=A0A1J7IEE2_9PEZI|nr:hypothetical protein CONLIGDRAFT_708549 [Coniochaeta ligniaria NRRL 30616]